MSAVTATPDWLDVLGAECGRTSQARVAKALGVSAAMINQALKGKYAGDIDGLKARVEGAYMGALVACPVLGELAQHECIEHQHREFANTSHVRVMLYRACRNGCPHSRISKE